MPKVRGYKTFGGYSDTDHNLHRERAYGGYPKGGPACPDDHVWEDEDPDLARVNPPNPQPVIGATFRG